MPTAARPRKRPPPSNKYDALGNRVLQREHAAGFEAPAPTDRPTPCDDGAGHAVPTQDALGNAPHQLRRRRPCGQDLAERAYGGPDHHRPVHAIPLRRSGPPGQTVQPGAATVAQALSTGTDTTQLIYNAFGELTDRVVAGLTDHAEHNSCYDTTPVAQQQRRRRRDPRLPW